VYFVCVVVRAGSWARTTQDAAKLRVLARALPTAMRRVSPARGHPHAMSFKFGLQVKNNVSVGLAKPAAKPALNHEKNKTKKKKKPLLDDGDGDGDDDDDHGKAKARDGAQAIGEFSFDDTLAAAAAGPPKPNPRPKKGQPAAPPTRKPRAKDDDPTLLENSASAKEAEQRAQDALKADATLYDYDAAYDALHARTTARKAAEAADGEARKPKYMDSLVEAAELRKKDQLRARDKFLARERENEGDEYADKEKFVTGAYKSHQEEARIAEADEEKRVAAEEEKRRKTGMLGFHKQMLAEQEKRHQEAMDAAAQAAKDGYQAPAAEEEAKTDEQIAQDLRAQGKTVLLNEDGQVADKRQLLSAGLNVIAKPKPKPTAAAAAPAAAKPTYTAPKSGRNAQRERQTHMVAQQIEAAAKRKADEEADEQAKLQHASKSQKTETDILSAKERYLQRRKEAAAAAGR
jgi:coiled-coil domain-containing protein 55